MKMPRLISKRIKQRQEKELNTPKYKIKNLYTGKVNMPLGEFDRDYVSVKDFAVCYICPCCNELVPINTHGLPHCRIVSDVKPFKKSQKEYIKINDLTPNSKLSLQQIIDIENEHNKTQNQDYTIFN